MKLNPLPSQTDIGIDSEQLALANYHRTRQRLVRLVRCAVVVAAIGSSDAALAANCGAINSGNWNVQTTWGAAGTGCAGAPGGIPGAADNVTISGGRGVDIPAGYAAAAETLNIGSNANSSNDVTLLAATSSLVVDTDLTITRGSNNGNTNSLIVNAGTVTVTGDVTLAGANATASRINSIVVTTGTLNIHSDMVFVAGAATNNLINMSSSTGTINLGGAFTATVGTLQNGGTSTFNYNGTVAQTVLVGVSSIVYGNLHLNNTSATGATLGAAITATNQTGNLRVQSGTFNNGGFAITGAAGDTFEVASGAVFNMTGTAGYPAFPVDALGATSTVRYRQTNAQTISAETYGNLEVLPGANTITHTFAAGTTGIAGNLVMGNGTNSGVAVTAATNATTLNVTGNLTIAANTTFTAHATNALTLAGNWTNNGTFAGNGGRVVFSGTGAQAIAGTATTTFANVTFNKTAGTMTLSTNATVSAQLALTNGVVSTGANTLTMTASCTANVARTSGHVAGSLRLRFPTGSPTCTFPVGDAGTLPGAAYTPITATLTTVGTSGDLTGRVTAAEQPNIATSQLDAANSADRYWTMVNPGGIAFTSASLTFTYVAADLDGGATPLEFVVGDYSGTTWRYPDVGTVTATTIQAQGIEQAAIAGDYAAAAMSMNSYSYWRMNETSWNGTANEVTDFGSGSNHGTAASLGATAKPTTDNVSPAPAIAGSPGTCRYGRFNRTNKNYVALPAGYPGLTAAGQSGFSITAWINSTNTALPGQRILIDDQNDTAPGAWGFSVGETDRAGAGGVRFYYRQGTTFTLDTVAVPSNQWLFVALSVSLATGTDASRGTIYVYNTAGTLVTTYTATFTWTPGSDAGPPSIGGETNASTEGTDQFGFAGALDELRVFRAALSQDMFNKVRQLGNPCDLTSHYAISGSTTGVTCDASLVQFTAHDAGHNPVSPSAGTVLNLTTSTGTGLWQAGLQTGTGSWGPSGLNNGMATYIWPGGQTSFSVNLRHNSVATLSINAADSNGKVELPAEDLSIAFTDTAFRVTANGTTTATIGTQLSAKNSNVGFGLQTLYLQAIRTDTNTGSCVGLIQNQTVTIEMAAARVNPTAAPTSGSLVRVLNSSSALVPLGTGSGVAGTYTNVTLAFDANSMAPLVVNYADAGSISLFARYQLPSPPSGIFVLGTSNTFVVRPFGLRISGPPSGLSGPTSLRYAKAGATWLDNVTVSAVAWEAADDASDNNGVPDNDAALIGNAVTTNFGEESTAATASLTHTLAEPSGGNSGTLTTSLPAFNNGTASTSASWSEVGLINLFAISTGYLGSGQNVRNSAGGFTGVGRFYPDHFFVVAGSTLTNRSEVLPACSPASSFTYMNEPLRLNFTLQARNTGGVITQNYASGVGGFAKLNPTTVGQLGFGALSGTTDLTLRLDTATVPTGTFTAGVAPVEAVLDLNRQASGSADGPFPTARFGIAPIDSDTVALRPADLNMDVLAPAGNDHQQIGASTDIRFGRMRLQNAHGSAALDLPISLRTEYYNGTTFITNTADGCTKLSSSDVRFDFITTSPKLAACDTITSPATSILFTGGVAALKLTKPTGQRDGVVDLTVNLAGASGITCITAASSPASNAAMPWLLGNWTGSTYTDNPRGRHTFGVFKGADEFIYMQENY